MKKIAFISQPEYFRFIYEHDLDKDFEVREFPFKFDMKDEDFDDLVKFQADYNFFFRGEFFPENTLEKLNGLKIALSSEPFPRKVDSKWEYTKDSIKRYLVFRRIREKKFDYIFHYDISSLPLFEKDNLGISGEFVFPVALDTYKSKKVPKKWDFLFIGRSSDHREKFFGPLKHHFNFLHIAHGVWGPELVDYMSQCKVCLNVHAEPEISWEPRMQKMLASNTFVMSEKITPNKYLRPGIDYIEFTTPQDLYEKAKSYLEDESAREKIIKNATERIESLFDSRKNFTKLVKDLENNKYPKFRPKKRGMVMMDVMKKGMRLF